MSLIQRIFFAVILELQSFVRFTPILRQEISSQFSLKLHQSSICRTKKPKEAKTNKPHETKQIPSMDPKKILNLEKGFE